VKDFRDLKVWQKAHQLTLSIYQATSSFPSEEKYGLVTQLRRSAVSIPSNIAEGCGRGSDPELGRFLQVAMGSASELEYELLLSHELGFVNRELHQELSERTTEVKRMLASLLQKLNAKAER
jgi:four helix bundle protein